MYGRHTRSSGPLDQDAEPAGADALSDVLEGVRLTGALFFVVNASTPWVAAAPESSALGPVILPRAQHVVSYHVVTEGTCWFHTRAGPEEQLNAGDVVVVPHGDGYSLSSPACTRSDVSQHDSLAWFRQMVSGDLPLVVDEGGGGDERLRVVCGFLGCDALPFNPVLASLPRILHVRRARVPESDGLATLAGLVASEVIGGRAGSRSVLLRLGELLFVEVVRRYLNTLRAGEGGWLGGLRDPIVGPALASLHRHSHHPWTLEKLARQVGTSRSVLAERFTQLVGQPPIHYLARWRMQRAAALLDSGHGKVRAVAHDVGYGSEAAFSRAFKHLTGMSPAAWRDRGRLQATSLRSE